MPKVRVHRKKLDAATKQQISDSMKRSWKERRRNGAPKASDQMARDLAALQDAGRKHISRREQLPTGVDMTIDYEAALMGKTNRELRIIAATRARDLAYAADRLKEANRSAAVIRFIVGATLRSLPNDDRLLCDYEVGAIRAILSTVSGGL